ncbi:MAG TPA: hypothetical protein PKE14_03690, partial [Chitinophagales bacterium]|nr:hypothetical protein [Chitinophagales bacterium]
MAIGAHSGNFVYNNVQTNEAFVYSSAQSVPDSSIAIDSTKNDSLLLNGNDLWYAVSPDALDQIINYKGVDSIIYDLDSGKTYIYAK